MAEQRMIIEMGEGRDLHGMDYTKACARAIRDAFSRSSLPIFGVLGLDHDVMRVQVTVAVQDPDAVDVDALTGLLPRGRASVTAVAGGLNVVNPDTGDTTVIAAAAVEAFLPPQTGWRIRSD